MIHSPRTRPLSFETLQSRELCHAGPAGEEGVVPLANFTLTDVNPASPSHGEQLSPSQFQGSVSAWYFAYASCTYCAAQFEALDQIAAELQAAHPLLEIEVVGVNAHDRAFANATFVEGRSLPWLQDVDADSNGQSDAWEAWQVDFRDLVVVDGDGVPLTIVNLSAHDLTETANAAALRATLIDAAMTSQIPFHHRLRPFDTNNDGVVAPLDALLVIIELNARGSRKLAPPTGDALESYVDTNGDGLVTPLDALLIITHLNAVAADSAAGEPAPQLDAWQPMSLSTDRDVSPHREADFWLMNWIFDVED